MTERVKWTETRTIDGFTVSVEALESLEYNGQWVYNGYRVTSDGESIWFFGWPTDSDIKRRLG